MRGADVVRLAEVVGSELPVGLEVDLEPFDADHLFGG